MSYQPRTFNYTIDQTTGLRKYEDPRLQITYLNLKKISGLVFELQTRARIDLLDAQNNVGAKAVHDQTAEILGMFASKIFEGISVIFTTGTPAAIISMIAGRLISGIITLEVKESDPQDDIQRKANEIRDGMDAIFDELKRRIDEMIVYPEKYWNEVYHCEGYTDPKLKGDVTLADFAEACDVLLPDPNTPEYDDFFNALQERCRYIIVSQLLSAKWFMKNWPSYWFKDFYQINGQGEHYYDFDHTVYNPHTDEDYWCQHFSALPGNDLGSWYEIESSEGHLHFMKWLYDLCHSPGRSDKYSSYHTDCDDHSSIDGNRHYNGAIIHNMILVDSNSDYSPESLTGWLFKDDSFGNIINKRGIATRKQVYREWGLKTI
jgi:hypothetical protein